MSEFVGLVLFAIVISLVIGVGIAMIYCGCVVMCLRNPDAMAESVDLV